MIRITHTSHFFSPKESAVYSQLEQNLPSPPHDSTNTVGPSKSFHKLDKSRAQSQVLPNHMMQKSVEEQHQHDGQRKNRNRNRARNRNVTPAFGDNDDYETLGSENEIAEGSSMTESSNQIDVRVQQQNCYTPRRMAKLDQEQLKQPGYASRRVAKLEQRQDQETVYGPKPKTMHRDKREQKPRDEVSFQPYQRRIHHSEQKFCFLLLKC